MNTPHHTFANPRALAQGFTLIELMIAVAIIGILAAIALPQYSQYVMRSRRADAVNALSSMAAAQERYRLINPSYASAVTALNSLVSTVSSTSTDGNYTLSVVSATASAFSVQAAAVAGKPQANDAGCTTITLSQAGEYSPVDCVNR